MSKSRRNIYLIGSAVLVLAGFLARGAYNCQSHQEPNSHEPISELESSVVEATPRPTPSLERLTIIGGQGRLSPARRVKNLIVNPDDSYRTVVKKSREDGFKELLELARTATQEELWVYIPQRQMWYEVGYKVHTIPTTVDRNGEVQTYTRPGIESLELLVRNLILSSNDLESVHIHPYLSIDSRDLPEEEFKVRSQIAGGPPSYEDLLQLLVHVVRQNEVNPNGSYTEYVVSLLGVAKYELTQAGRERYLKVKEEWGEQAMYNRFTNDLPMNFGYDLSQDIGREDVRIGIIKDTCQRLSSPYLKVTFTPYTAFTQPTQQSP